MILRGNFSYILGYGLFNTGLHYSLSVDSIRILYQDIEDPNTKPSTKQPPPETQHNHQLTETITYKFIDSDDPAFSSEILSPPDASTLSLRPQPFLILLSAALAHPLLLLSYRVRYSGHENVLGAYSSATTSSNYKITGKTHRNIWRAAKSIYRNEGGIRGFYRGFVPSALFLIALNYESFVQVRWDEEEEWE